MRDLQYQIFPSGGIQLCPARAEVLCLKVAEVEKAVNILYFIFLEPGGALVVVREETVTLVEVMVDVHVKSVGAFAFFG